MPRRSFDIVFTLALFALYATVALLLSAIGAQVYMAAGDAMSANYDQRTSVLYVTQKLRASDSIGSIRADHVGDSDALVLAMEADGDRYETWIYVYDGQLCEALMADGNRPEAAYGQAIMPMQGLHIDAVSLRRGLVLIEFELADGTTSRLQYYLMSGDLR